MNYALFYSVMQHMSTWGYSLRKDAQPCLVLEYIENMINDYGKDVVGASINQDMERFMSSDWCEQAVPVLLVHPTLEDLFVKDSA